MPIVDDRGRLFGRVNLVDAGAALLVVMLIAAVYASWWLLRTPAPVVESVTPSRLAPGQTDQQIEVRGRNLRPYLHANIGSQRVTYLFESWDKGRVQVPALEPGQYDLALFDGDSEVGRFPNAVTVRSASTVEIVVRCVARPEILEAVKRAHSDPRAAQDASRLGLLWYELVDEIVGTTESLMTTPAELTRGESKKSRLVIFNARIRLEAAASGGGWQTTDGTTLKAGALFKLNAPTYLIAGEILDTSHDQ